MIRRDTILVMVVGSLVVLPAFLAMAAYKITQNPALRPLGITIEQMIEAGQIQDKSLIIAEVTFGSEATTEQSLADYRTAMSNAFAMFQTEARVRFREAEGRSDITIKYIIGHSEIGPYPVSRAAEGIRPAVEAERMVARQRASLEELENKRRQNGNFWERLFAGS